MAKAIKLKDTIDVVIKGDRAEIKTSNILANTALFSGVGFLISALIIMGGSYFLTEAETYFFSICLFGISALSFLVWDRTSSCYVVDFANKKLSKKTTIYKWNSSYRITDFQKVKIISVNCIIQNAFYYLSIHHGYKPYYSVVLILESGETREFSLRYSNIEYADEIARALARELCVSYNCGKLGKKIKVNDDKIDITFEKPSIIDYIPAIFTSFVRLIALVTFITIISYLDTGSLHLSKEMQTKITYYINIFK